MTPKKQDDNRNSFCIPADFLIYLIYPGKLTVADTFRIGCIGHLTSKDMHEVLDVVKETLKELDIKSN